MLPKANYYVRLKGRSNNTGYLTNEVYNELKLFTWSNLMINMYVGLTYNSAQHNLK